jgi:hypothetical protein
MVRASNVISCLEESRIVGLTELSIPDLPRAALALSQGKLQVGSRVLLRLRR